MSVEHPPGCESGAPPPRFIFKVCLYHCVSGSERPLRSLAGTSRMEGRGRCPGCCATLSRLPWARPSREDMEAR